MCFYMYILVYIYIHTDLLIYLYTKVYAFHFEYLLSAICRLNWQSKSDSINIVKHKATHTLRWRIKPLIAKNKWIYEKNINIKFCRSRVQAYLQESNVTTRCKDKNWKSKNGQNSDRK